MSKNYTPLLVLALGTLALTHNADARDPYAKPDDSWISISGTVADPGADSFTLDYGTGRITVEMDDWDDYGDAHALLEGDHVTVYGMIDDDLFEKATIEAGSVYVESLNSYFYASAADEEDTAYPMYSYTPYYWATPAPIEPAVATIRGTVTGVDAAAAEFHIDTGTQRLTVETDELGYDPLDDTGYQKIEYGDRVSVSGEFDYDFLEGRVFEADAVVTLADDSKRQG
ncbi:MAG: hypothetical protein RLW61_16080 [Gammaproteobacteria bacterium]|uniref:hypothetical protein n=1 Tax=Oceanibaculum nanhaiense TaxID=1909734 RepID=UPI0032EF02C5